jgi:hypothetical protein
VVPVPQLPVVQSTSIINTYAGIDYLNATFSVYSNSILKKNDVLTSFFKGGLQSLCISSGGKCNDAFEINTNEENDFAKMLLDIDNDHDDVDVDNFDDDDDRSMMKIDLDHKHVKTDNQLHTNGQEETITTTTITTAFSSSVSSSSSSSSTTTTTSTKSSTTTARTTTTTSGIEHGNALPIQDDIESKKEGILFHPVGNNEPIEISIMNRMNVSELSSAYTMFMHGCIDKASDGNIRSSKDSKQTFEYQRNIPQLLLLQKSIYHEVYTIDLYSIVYFLVQLSRYSSDSSFNSFNLSSSSIQTVAKLRAEANAITNLASKTQFIRKFAPFVSVNHPLLLFKYLNVENEHMHRHILHVLSIVMFEVAQAYFPSIFSVTSFFFLENKAKKASSICTSDNKINNKKNTNITLGIQLVKHFLENKLYWHHKAIAKVKEYDNIHNNSNTLNQGQNDDGEGDDGENDVDQVGNGKDEGHDAINRTRAKNDQSTVVDVTSNDATKADARIEQFVEVAQQSAQQGEEEQDDDDDDDDDDANVEVAGSVDMHALGMIVTYHTIQADILELYINLCNAKLSQA